MKTVDEYARMIDYADRPLESAREVIRKVIDDCTKPAEETNHDEQLILTFTI